MPKLSNPARVAKEVIKQAEENKLINIEKACLAVGYSKSTARHNSSAVVNSSQYKNALLNEIEQIDARIKDSNSILTDKKKISKATWRDGLEGYIQLNKLKLLLSGDKPAVNIQVNWE